MTTYLDTLDIDSLTLAEFEQYLPDFFAVYNGHISDNPRFNNFLGANPDCANLVRDLEYIAATAKSLFDPVEEPSDAIWKKLEDKLHDIKPDHEDVAHKS
jgi:hypothetical protein